MKKLVYILILNCCMLLSVYGQDFYMYVNGQKQYYEISSTQLLIRTTFTDTMAVKSFVQDKTFGEIRKSEILKEGLVMLELQKEDSKSTLELLRKYNADNTILYTSPVLVDDKGKVIGGITNPPLAQV